MRRQLRLAALLGVALTSCLSEGPTAPGESGIWKATNVHVVTVDGLDRSYTLHVPERVRRGTGGVVAPYPLVIVMHGSSDDGKGIEATSRMDVVADSALFIVAYPNGTGGRFGVYASNWNAGTCCGGANRDNVDDLAFITALIKHTSQHVAVDVRRVYVAGFSAGALMAYHAGCQLSASIAAIAVVEGNIADENCRPSKAVSLWAVHGTDDPQVAFTEPSATSVSGTVPVVARALPPSVQFWAVQQKCTGGSTKTVSTAVTNSQITGCTSGAVVEFNKIVGGTHGWPGGTSVPGSLAPMNQLSSSNEIWKFFAKHTRN
jgi:polyhydroxybutyrate depolymerase